MRRLLRLHGKALILILLLTIFLVTLYYGFLGAPGRSSVRKAIKEAVNVDSPEVLSEWDMILVNRWTPIPDGFEVKTAETESGYEIDKRVKKDLEEMLRDCRDAGCSPVICSAYRSHEDQEKLFERETQGFLDRGLDRKEAEAKASEATAIPGTSEHECGLAVDIIDSSYQVLDDRQEETETQKWLMKHCSEYGFILRYPNDKKEITGIIYEPWHYRYVGRDNAKDITGSGLCLEEYIRKLSGDAE